MNGREGGGEGYILMKEVRKALTTALVTQADRESREQAFQIFTGILQNRAAAAGGGSKCKGPV